jgi:pseudouridine-5'-phosphate glycosidase
MSGSIQIESTPEVADALTAGHPVVALESTIITHGMPWPGNRDMALEVEAAIRTEGAVPATIAVIDGRLHAGLSQAAITELAQAKDVMKLSRADFAFALAERRTGATTVAATLKVSFSLRRTEPLP